MSATQELRFVRHDDPHAFLEATKRFDDTFMRFCLGSLYDYISNPPSVAVNGPTPVYLFTVYRGNDLMITLSHNNTDYAWMLSIPSSAVHTLLGTLTTPGLLAPAVSLLASSTLDQLSSNPLVLNKMVGLDAAVDAFVTVWTDLLASRGLHVRIHSEPNTAFNGSRVSYATRASLTHPPTTPFPHAIVQASTDDLEPVAQLYMAFQRGEPWHRVVTREDALAVLKEPVKAGLVWYLCVDGEPAGYVMLGRTTPRTIAIRNVFVLDSHRRKGIAEAMVRGVTRYFLNAPPYGVQPAREGPPLVGFKEEVHLNVSDESAERVYKRSGFLFPDKSGVGGIDPTTGRKSWFTLANRDIVQELKPSSERR